MMRSNRPSVKTISVVIMNGRNTSNDRKITRIFGTKASVISCIWVRAWNNETTRLHHKRHQHQR